jgi:hypothetical protein
LVLVGKIILIISNACSLFNVGVLTMFPTFVDVTKSVKLQINSVFGVAYHHK